MSPNPAEFPVTMVLRVREGKDEFMFYTLGVVLAVIWLLGMVADFTIGGFIHVLLLAAVVMIVAQMIHGRKKLKSLNLESVESKKLKQ
jgi:hypothetical protein